MTQDDKKCLGKRKGGLEWRKDFPGGVKVPREKKRCLGARCLGRGKGALMPQKGKRSLSAWGGAKVPRCLGTLGGKKVPQCLRRAKAAQSNLKG